MLNLPANYERPWYLLYQTVHGKPLATGYVTRDDPAVLRERAPVLSHFWFLGPDIHTQHFDLAGQGVQVLHDLLGVRWVVLDRYKMPGGPEREITDAYAQSIFAGQAPLFEDERITVYAVPEPADAWAVPYPGHGLASRGRATTPARCGASCRPGAGRAGGGQPQRRAAGAGDQRGRPGHAAAAG